MNFVVMPAVALGFLAATSLAIAQQSPLPSPAMTAQAAPVILTTVPSGSLTVTDWYKQNVYDIANAKIGEISDVLISPSDGKVTAFVIGVGGFLGMGEKEIAIPFDGLRRTVTDDTSHLTLDVSKEALKGAPGLRYDRKTSTWIVAQADAK